MTVRPCVCHYSAGAYASSKLLHSVLLTGRAVGSYTHSSATIGGGYGTSADGECVLAVAEQRVADRSCFVHVLLSVMVLPRAIAFGHDRVAVWVQFFRSDSTSKPSLRSVDRVVCTCLCA